MKSSLLLAVLLLIAARASAADDDGWTPLFNGKDLSNWVNVNCAPATWGVKDGVITCTGKPIGALRTPRMYENFIFEADWRHLKSGGNSGIFIWASPISATGAPFLRAIEVQVLDNGYDARGKNEWYTTHGDLFPIWGSTIKPIYKGNGMRCFPIEERSKSSPEGNHYKIVGNGSKLRLSVNGKEVSGGDECNWRKGYIGLESEGSPVEFRNLRIKELPASGAMPEQTAFEDKGWKPLYTGVDLHGWKTDPQLSKQWQVEDWILTSRGGAGVLRTEKEFGDFELIVDCQLPKEPRGVDRDAALPAIVLPLKDGDHRIPLAAKPGQWTRFVLTLHGDEITLKQGDSAPTSSPLPSGIPARRTIGVSGSVSGTQFANFYLRELK